jgi:CubicO group peptidase (beta-lactamase class C family)
MVRRLAIGGWLACVLAGVSVALVAKQAAPDLAPQVDKVFEKWASTTTPGCAVGVSVGGRTVVSKAYGMADLEHDVRNTPETIFEAGSVSKQFTAAAVLLLARDGKLLLDDPVRKYIPELPDYGQPLTIRHMLTHTSGLRDWGSVAGIGGWPRTSRVYTHAHVLEIVSRQRALNFTPGERYSYSNTGYNLAAILVSRVSGMSFAEFTRQRIFEPSGMTKTSWRDDYGRIVKGRALSYVPDGSSFRTVMPFENVHGNGGLLTTVGDLLKWNEHLSNPSAADATMVAEQERPGRFNDGRAHGYALGLAVGDYKGVREIAHSGSTAGYQANLARYPDAKLSVAVLCNAANAGAGGSSEAVADLYLGSRLKPTAAKATYTLTAADLDGVVGAYRDTRTGRITTIERDGGAVRIGRGPALVPVSARRFVTDDGDAFEVNGSGAATTTDIYGTVDRFVRVTPATPTVAALGEFVGVYTSDEAEVTLTAAIDGTTLVLERRPETVIRLTPLYADAFSGSIGTVLFRREGGRVTGLSVVQDRVWDLKFTRRPDTAGTPERR